MFVSLPLQMMTKNQMRNMIYFSFLLQFEGTRIVTNFCCNAVSVDLNLQTLLQLVELVVHKQIQCFQIHERDWE